MKKLTTKLSFSFDEELGDLTSDLDFTVNIPMKSIKKKVKIKEVKRKNFKKDASTKLF